jgi:hypothetical protein
MMVIGTTIAGTSVCGLEGLSNADEVGLGGEAMEAVSDEFGGVSEDEEEVTDGDISVTGVTAVAVDGDAGNEQCQSSKLSSSW